MDSIDEIRAMDTLFDRLFPITRSITGEGLRETLDILGEHLPLERLSIKSGTKVFDWEIPKEWVIREAWLTGPSGEKIVDFKKNNLHVVNYSTPINKKLSLGELKSHLHTIPHLPDAIPYVISYYKERWGFCLPQRMLEGLPEGEYHAYIDSEHIDGKIDFAHAILLGESKEEVLISSYVCHPSMANNELSGPIVAAFLYKRLAKWKRRRFTYRFVFTPETIGSLSYLSLFGKELKRNLYAGLVLTCLGGDFRLSYKRSREDLTQINQEVEHLFKHSIIEGTIRPFTPIHGSDERQYCSPGFNLPVGQMSRMVYGTYPGYHNSLDDKETMTIEALYKSVNEIELVLQSLEDSGFYINQSPFGEVKLDQHGLYPDFNSPNMGGYSNNHVADQRTQLNRILKVLNYADGKHSLIELAEKCECSDRELMDIITLLKEKQILKGPYAKEKGLLE